MGCPVILSDRCGSYGPNDDVQVGKNGFVYPVGNIPELANQIKTIIHDPALKIKFGKTSHEQGVGFQKHAHKIAINSLYQMLIEEKITD